MGLYAQRPARLVGQLVGDLVLLGWTVVCAVAALFVHRSVAALAEPVRDTARTASRLSGNLQDAAGEAARVPGVGEGLRRPFDAAAGSLGGLVTAAQNQAADLERLAALLGWLTFALPVLLAALWWLPRRIRFYRLARASERFLDSAADLDLFALRALAAQPLPVLARISDDPVAAWRAGDRQVVSRLADLELRRSGLRLPEHLREG